MSLAAATATRLWGGSIGGADALGRMRRLATKRSSTTVLATETVQPR
jgi:hypothetical protein